MKAYIYKNTILSNWPVPGNYYISNDPNSDEDMYLYSDGTWHDQCNGLGNGWYNTLEECFSSIINMYKKIDPNIISVEIKKEN